MEFKVGYRQMISNFFRKNIAGRDELPLKLKEEGIDSVYMELGNNNSNVCLGDNKVERKIRLYEPSGRLVYSYNDRVGITPECGTLFKITLLCLEDIEERRNSSLSAEKKILEDFEGLKGQLEKSGIKVSALVQVGRKRQEMTSELYKQLLEKPPYGFPF